jgi:hypothetical protein
MKTSEEINIKVLKTKKLFDKKLIEYNKIRQNGAVDGSWNRLESELQELNGMLKAFKWIINHK